MTGKFAKTYEKFDEALVRSCTSIKPADALWRSRLFINSSPGSILNPNTKQMLAQMLLRPGMTFANVLVEFGMLVGNVLGGPTERHHAEIAVDDLLSDLRGFGLITDMQQVLRSAP